MLLCANAWSWRPAGGGWLGPPAECAPIPAALRRRPNDRTQRPSGALSSRAEEGQRQSPGRNWVSIDSNVSVRRCGNPACARIGPEIAHLSDKSPVFPFEIQAQRLICKPDFVLTDRPVEWRADFGTTHSREVALSSQVPGRK